MISSGGIFFIFDVLQGLSAASMTPLSAQEALLAVSEALSAVSEALPVASHAPFEALPPSVPHLS